MLRQQNDRMGDISSVKECDIFHRKLLTSSKNCLTVQSNNIDSIVRGIGKFTANACCIWLQHDGLQHTIYGCSMMACSMVYLHYFQCKLLKNQGIEEDSSGQKEKSKGVN